VGRSPHSKWRILIYLRARKLGDPGNQVLAMRRFLIAIASLTFLSAIASVQPGAPSFSILILEKVGLGASLWQPLVFETSICPKARSSNVE
jgi:hypothetical protein